jgi:5-methylcytosine-specific restriction protein A
MKKYLCSEAGCNELLDKPGYCEKHKRKPAVPFSNAIKFNESLYKTTQWKKLRARHLKYNGCCVGCGKEENLIVDHIEPPRGSERLFFDEYNLQTLCTACHRIKTAKELFERKYRLKF